MDKTISCFLNVSVISLVVIIIIIHKNISRQITLHLAKIVKTEKLQQYIP